MTDKTQQTVLALIFTFFAIWFAIDILFVPNSWYWTIIEGIGLCAAAVSAGGRWKRRSQF